MTSDAASLRAQAIPAGRAWAEAALLVAALGGLVATRLTATRAGLDPLAVGAAFGIALTLVVAIGGSRPRLGREAVKPAMVGGAFGLILVLVALVGSVAGASAPVPGLGRPAAPFVPWAAVTVLVAVAEEGLLRGALFDRIRAGGGTLVAVLATTAVFALMHVPLYGWHVVPLDLAVGLGLGGLRLVTRGIVAPAVAHAVADLATWWL